LDVSCAVRKKVLNYIGFQASLSKPAAAGHESRRKPGQASQSPVK
jgi:hypothetical protein